MLLFNFRLNVNFSVLIQFERKVLKRETGEERKAQKNSSYSCKKFIATSGEKMKQILKDYNENK